MLCGQGQQKTPVKIRWSGNTAPETAVHLVLPLSPVVHKIWRICLFNSKLLLNTVSSHMQIVPKLVYLGFIVSHFGGIHENYLMVILLAYVIQLLCCSLESDIVHTGHKNYTKVNF